MKNLHVLLALGAVLMSGVAATDAYVNDTSTFTNTTDERLNIELTITDEGSRQVYDLYVLPDRTSVADFWADSFDATYAACAYGDVTGDAYGCLQGSISDADNNVYFGNNQQPFASTPSGLETDLFVFSAPAGSNQSAEESGDDQQHKEDDDDSTFVIFAKCFIDSMVGAEFKRTGSKIGQRHQVDSRAMSQLFEF